MKTYAGIGARETPGDALELMTALGYYFASHDFVLRSGGADGADVAFEMGVELYCEDNNIKSKTEYKEIYTTRDDIPPWTDVFTELFHPNPGALKDYSRKLMNRNACQILGLDGRLVCEFVVCWTKDGKDTGGTGQAIRIANFYNIPVYNLKRNEDKQYLIDCVESDKLPT